MFYFKIYLILLTILIFVQFMILFKCLYIKNFNNIYDFNSHTYII